MDIQDVYTLLRCLGASAKYKGFFPTADAVWLCVQEPEWLVGVTRRLYPEIGRKYGMNWRAVERNIRTVATVVWKNNPVMLSQLAGMPLAYRPSVAQFLDILSSALPRETS